ncbi:MAG: tetratricopeptide repeat protein, partial [Bacteroidales bacterium]|nr:tetratricopeptide repeat protein [Bacteroidales bacterium]
MRTNKYILVIVGLLLIMASNQIEAQSSTARKETRKGNKEYKAKKYDQSEVNYRRAIHDDSNAYRAQYNLGNALYKQKKYDEANSHYSKALETPDLNNKNKAKILHNRGNSSLKAGLAKENRAEGMQQFQQAVNDYQEALKLTPKDENTRYNLSYAKKMLQQAQQQQQQQQNGGGGGGQDQKDQNKDKN